MVEGERPVVRGRHMKSLVGALEVWDGGARPLALLPAEALGTISSAGGLDWLPVALDLQVTQAIYDGLGSAEADRFFRAHTLESFEGPILQTLVSTGVRIFGLDPVSFLRWVPRGWHLIFRGVGEWRVPAVPPGATSVALVLASLPGECAEHAVWVRSVARSIAAVLDLARVAGSVELLPRARGGREVHLSVRWSARQDAGGPPGP